MHLGSLIQTRQYASLAQGELRALVAENSVLDVPTRISATATFLNSISSPEEMQQALQVLTHLAQQHDTPFDQVLLIARILYRNRNVECEGGKQAIQILLNLMQWPDLSFEQTILTALALYEFSPSESEEEHQAIQVFFAVIQRPDTSFEKILQVALALYLTAPERTGKLDAVSLCLHMKRFEIFYDAAAPIIRDPLTLFGGRGRTYSTFSRMLLDLGQYTRFSFEQVVEFAQLHVQIFPSASHLQFALEMLVEATDSHSLSFEEAIVAAQVLYQISSPKSKEEQQAIQKLSDMAWRLDLSFEQSFLVATSLYLYSDAKSEQEQRSIQRLLDLAQQSNLSFEQTLLITQALCQLGSFEAEEKQKAIQKLSNLTKQANFSLEQTMFAAHLLYWSSPGGSLEEQQAKEILLGIAQQPNLPLEQFFKVAITCLLTSVKPPSREATATSTTEQDKIVSKLFSDRVQRSDISTEQKILLTKALYVIADINTPEEQVAAELVWQQVQEHSLTVNQRMQLVTIPLETNEANYSRRAQAIRILLDLVQGETAKRYIREYWQTPSADKIVEVSDIPSLAYLATQEMLPSEIRDEVYKVLRSLVAQFDSSPPH